MQIIDIVGIGGIPLIIALVSVWKGWNQDSRTYPLVALALGLIINVLAAYAQATSLALGVLYGVTAGLAAAGLYSGSKAVAGR